MANALFPEMTPSARKYTPGKIAEKQFVAQNGATTFIQYGSRHVNSTLEMTFANIDDKKAQELIDFYEACTPSTDVIFTGANGMGGADWAPDLTLSYRFSSPPQVSSVGYTRSTVSCKFTGYLRGN